MGNHYKLIPVHRLHLCSNHLHILCIHNIYRHYPFCSSFGGSRSFPQFLHFLKSFPLYLTVTYFMGSCNSRKHFRLLKRFMFLPLVVLEAVLLRRLFVSHKRFTRSAHFDWLFCHGFPNSTAEYSLIFQSVFICCGMGFLA